MRDSGRYMLSFYYVPEGAVEIQEISEALSEVVVKLLKGES